MFNNNKTLLEDMIEYVKNDQCFDHLEKLSVLFEIWLYYLESIDSKYFEEDISDAMCDLGDKYLEVSEIVSLLSRCLATTIKIKKETYTQLVRYDEINQLVDKVFYQLQDVNTYSWYAETDNNIFESIRLLFKNLIKLNKLIRDAGIDVDFDKEYSGILEIFDLVIEELNEEVGYLLGEDFITLDTESIGMILLLVELGQEFKSLFKHAFSDEKDFIHSLDYTSIDFEIDLNKKYQLHKEWEERYEFD